MAPPFTWVPYSGGEIPSNMVRGNSSGIYVPLYVCRAQIDGADVAGKFSAVNKTAYFPCAGKEHALKKCEILCCDDRAILRWVPASKGVADDAAVFVGYDTHGLLFVARGKQSGEMIPGKLSPARKTCYVSTGYKEFSCPDYEVLVFDSYMDINRNDLV